MANAYKNKVVYNGNTLIDLSDTTAVAADVNSGKYVYLADGSRVQGSQTVYTVSETLTHVTSTNQATKIISGDSFHAVLTPDSGYRIESITVTMGGVDITSQVFSPGTGAKAITSNGTYNASDDMLGGYSQVTVNVPGGGGDAYTRTVVIPEQTVTPASNGTYNAATLTGASAFVAGDDYIVTYGGTEYYFTCQIVFSVDYLLGDVNYFFGNTGMPYPFGIIWESGTTATLATGDSTSVSVKVEKVEIVDDIDLGTKTITQNGTYAASSDSLDGFSSVTVNVVPTGSQTYTANGTYDVSSLATAIVNVSGGGSSVKTGTITPTAASTTLTFDTGLSSVTGILIMPINTPLTGSRTQAAMICLSSGSFYKAISIHTNSSGAGWVSPSVYTSSRFTQSGTNVTVTGAYSFRPATGYVWFAW